MADNVELDAGSGGATIATDDVGGAQYQRVKLDIGGDGVSSPVVSGNPLPVAGTVDLGATDNAVLDAIQAATEATQAAVEGTLAVSNAGLTELAAAINASSQVDVNIAASGATVPISHAALTELAAAIDTEVQVDVVSSALPSGAATAANQSTIIGHLDGVEGLLTTIDADTGGILTAVQTIDNAIAGNEMQVDVVGALPAGTNNIGDVDVASIAAGTNNIGNVGLIPRTSGGLTIFRSIDLDESEEEIKGSAGQVYWIHAINLSTGVRYLKLYNATAANVTVGTTTPVLTFPIPTQGDSNGAGFTTSIPQGLAFGTAITAAATTGIADNDTGAPGANEVVLNVGYA